MLCAVSSTSSMQSAGESQRMNMILKNEASVTANLCLGFPEPSPSPIPEDKAPYTPCHLMLVARHLTLP